MIIFAVVLAAVAVAAFVLGTVMGKHQGSAGLEEAALLERRLVESRESDMRERLSAATEEIATLRAKAEELAAVRQQLKSEQDKYTQLFRSDQEKYTQQLRSEQDKYAQMKTDLDAAFKAAAADALRANAESFLTLARKELGGQTQEARQTMAQKEEAIKNMLDPLGKALKSLDEQTRAIEKERSGAYGEIKTLVEGLGKEIPESLRTLRAETAQLVTALRAPKTRGNWGELQLKRCVEYAGMVEYCSFAEQTSTRTEDDRLLRPDMAIQLPNGRSIIVDAKTPLDAFLDSADAGDAAAQSARFAAHAERVKAHLRDLSSKAYWKQFAQTPEFVVCFLPSEALFSAALEADPSLIEFGSQANVVMATPTTLIALLKAVAYGWQQSKVAQSAEAIQETGRELYGKLVNAHEYFNKLGKALESAVGQYNKFVGAVEGRGGAFFHARRLGSLVHGNDELDVMESLPAEPRLLTAEDWETSQPLALAAEAESRD